MGMTFPWEGHMAIHIRRRDLITLFGGAAIMPSFFRPLDARAEAKPKMLRVGYVGVQSPDAPLYRAF